jgi:hypothetical protein
MTIERKPIETALDSDALSVKVGPAWFLAKRQGATVELSNGDWLIRVRAGPNKARGYITNIDDNRLGREFAFVMPKTLKLSRTPPT